MPGAMGLGVTDDGERPGHEQAAQIAVTLLADAAKPVPYRRWSAASAPTRSRPEIPPRSEGLWVGNGGDDSSGQHRTDAGSFIEPHAHLVRIGARP